MRLILITFLLCGSALCIDSSNDSNEISEEIKRANCEIDELKMRIKSLEDSYKSLQDSIDVLKSVVAKNSINETNISTNDAKIVYLSAEDTIAKASVYIDDEKFEEARALLKTFIDSNREVIYHGMVYFYIGESFFKQKQYKDSAEAYLRSCKFNPNGNKSADALYKLALSMKKLSKIEESKQVVAKILKDYKVSPEFLSKINALKKELDNSIANTNS